MVLVGVEEKNYFLDLSKVFDLEMFCKFFISFMFVYIFKEILFFFFSIMVFFGVFVIIIIDDRFLRKY